MNLKLIALFGCIGYGIWFATVDGKRVTEQHVEALYRDYLAAYDRGDGKAVCELFSDNFSGQFSSTSRSMPVQEVMSKTAACSAVDNFKQSKLKLENAVGHELHTNFEFNIKSITIAPDKKSATVDAQLETRIGTEQGPVLDMRSKQTDVIRRSFGKAQFVQSDGVVSFFK